MSIGYSKYGIIGGPLTQSVVDQLNVRRNIVSKQNSRLPEDISYLNSTTGWVRVTSAVDILDEDAFSPEEQEYEYSEALARINQLYGGTFSNISGPRGGFVERPDGRTSDASSYQYSETQGIVPMAGITNFQVQSKGTYGSLRGATFNFTVHSTEQFDILEQLYLRPGFTILLEWGHSQFLENDGNLNTNVSLFNSNKFFNTIEEPELRRELLNIRSTSNFYNYDFLYGFIKNFAWSYNGINYECQVDVISKGELISSIRSSFIAFGNESQESYNSSQFASEIDAVLSLLKNTSVESTYRNQINTPKIRNTVKESFINALLKDYNQYTEIFTDTEILIGDLTGTNTTRLTKYITLGTFLKMINKVGIFKGPKGIPLVEFYTGGEDEESTRKTPKFTTFPQHIALNPYINILPKTKSNSDTYNIATQTNKDTDEVLGIYLNVDFILNTLKEVRERDKQDDTLLNVVQKILSETEINLGGINEFSLHFEEDESLYYIVDRKVVPAKKDFEKSTDDKNPKSFIDLVGLKSEIENLNIISKLSGKLTSMIAIAAQNGSNTSTDGDILNVQRWNVGLRDRHLYEKSEGSVSKNSGTLEAEVFQVDEKLKKEFKEFISKVNTTDNDIHIGFDEQYFKGVKTLHSKITSQYLKAITSAKKENMPGLIPFELSFTIKGISGLKVGQSFKVNEFFLPERYRGRVGFIITGLDHTVKDSRWTTSVKTQMIIT